MTHVRKPSLILALLLLALLVFAPRPAHAQSFFEGLSTAGEVTGAVYLLGGTLTFLVLDAYHAPPKSQLPAGIAIAQVVYGGTLMAASTLFFAAEGEEVGVGLLVVGAAVAAIPIVGWSTRASRDKKLQTSVQLTGSGILLKGTF